jgi:hypothetical protein
MNLMLGSGVLRLWNRLDLPVLAPPKLNERSS